MSNNISNTSLPTSVCQPLFPVKHGSVLSRLIESRNVSSSRYPTIVSGYSDRDAHDKRDNAKLPKPCSRIPKPTPNVQGRAFEKSLRSYYPRSTPTTPSCLSRASSPTKSTRSNSSRASSPASKIASFRSIGNKRQTSLLEKPGIVQNRPPPSPRGFQQNINLTSNGKQSIYEPRPVRLAYGINGPQYKASQKTAADIANNNYNQYGRSRGKPTGCSVGLLPGERMTRKMVTDAENQRTSRMLHTQAVAQIEMKPIQICTPVTENGVVICPCQHEERACQTISAEMLFKKSFNKACKDKNLETISVDLDTCSKCDETDARLKERDAECQKLQGCVQELQAALDDLFIRNEMLEIQLFECKEKIEENRCAEDTRIAQHYLPTDLNVESTVAHTLIPTIDAGVETDKDIFQTQLKFALETFLLAQISSRSTVEAGDSAKIGSDDENNNNYNDYHHSKVAKLALSVRDALLNEIRIKLKKGYTILQQRCEPLMLEPTNADDSKTVLLKKYQDIAPLEVEDTFHSYRKFVRFIHTYVDHSLAEIREFDIKVFNLNSNYDYLEENGKNDNEEEVKSEIHIPLVSVRTDSAPVDHEIVGEECNENYQEFENTAPEKPNNVYGETPCGSQEETELFSPETLVLFMSSKAGDEEDLICNNPDQAETEDIPRPEDPKKTASMDSCETAPFVTPLLKDPIIDRSEPEPIPSYQNVAQRLSVLEWFTTPEKKAVGESTKISPLAAAKLWLERTQSPLTTFILKPISIAKLFDPVDDPESVQLAWEEDKETAFNGESTEENATKLVLESEFNLRSNLSQPRTDIILL